MPREFLAGEEASIRIQMVSATVLQMVQVGARERLNVAMLL